MAFECHNRLARYLTFLLVSLKARPINVLERFEVIAHMGKRKSPGGAAASIRQRVFAPGCRLRLGPQEKQCLRL
jgi:hypothetical protein